MTTVVGLNQKALSTLVDWDAPLLVSAFVPVDFSAPQAREPINKTLRRMAQMANSTLTDHYGLSHGAAATFVAPMLDESLLDDVPEASRGLAVFMSSKKAVHLAVPMTVGPAVEVGEQLDVLRLLPVVVDDAEFYALTIGKKGAKLFRGARFELTNVVVPGMPDSLDEALWYIRREPIHTRVGSGVLHGSGGGEDLRKDDVRQYIHMIDKAITPILNKAEAPLVVIGVEYETAMFINHTHYRHTLEIPVLGSPDSMTTAEIHDRSWKLAGAMSHSADQALDRFARLAGTGRTATEAAEVIAASQNGSVGDLLVARSLTVDVDASPMPAAERHIATAAVNACLRHRATIHLVTDESLPSGVRIAAVLRY